MKAHCPAASPDADLVFGYGGRRATRSAGISPKRWRRSATRRAPSTRSTRWSGGRRARPRPGDHVLVMSNGGFGGVHQKLLDALRRAGQRHRVILYLHGFRSSPQSFKARAAAPRALAELGRARRMALPAAAGVAAARRVALGGIADAGEAGGDDVTRRSAVRSAAITRRIWPRSTAGARCC